VNTVSVEHMVLRRRTEELRELGQQIVPCLPLGRLQCVMIGIGPVWRVCNFNKLLDLYANGTNAGKLNEENKYTI